MSEKIHGSLFEDGRRAVADAADRAERSGLDDVGTSIDRGVPHEEVLEYVVEPTWT
ncbi:hypothetical protein [Natrarchaeobius halalkaliphilus]|uniref:hypothetical protein n=1 Tax=Natrarchaeobius halalkaliphilus TaxID=1679091 RepID=UPI0014046ACA|nr:hypothetical protein [Natrarchaeobius halalkaliphilus]